MARTLTLKGEGSSDPSLNFLTGTFYLSAGGWKLQVIPTGEDMVWETFLLKSTATDDNIRIALNDLDYLQRRVLDWISEPNAGDAVVLQFANDSEITKEAVILDIHYEVLSMGRMDALMYTDGLVVQLALLRSHWENVSQFTSNDLSINVGGGKWIISRADDGTMPARILEFGVEIDNTIINEFWLGIRPPNSGVNGFISRWDCEEGVNISANDCEKVSGTASYGTNVMEIDFATETDLAKRFYVSWGNIAATNFADIRGRYMVLGRIKSNSAAGEIRVQTKAGYCAGADDYREVIGETFIDFKNTNWFLYELGEVTIPPSSKASEVTTDFIKQFVFEIWLEEYTTCTVQFDCLILIPAKHMIKCKASGGVFGLNVGDELLIFSARDGSFSTFAVNNSGLIAAASSVESVNNWAAPFHNYINSVCVVAVQSTTSHSNTGTVNLSLKTYSRFRSYDAV